MGRPRKVPLIKSKSESDDEEEVVPKKKTVTSKAKALDIDDNDVMSRSLLTGKSQIKKSKVDKLDKLHDGMDITEQMSIISEVQDSFLADLENRVSADSKKKQEPEELKPVEQEPEQIRPGAINVLNNIISRRKKTGDVVQPREDYSNIPEEERPTELMGKDKRALIAKINQYKALFPDKLGDFKIKKNPTIRDLQDVLLEFDAIVETSNVDGFITEGILMTLRQIEGVTANSKNFNISGMSEMLKANKEFHTVCKQLYIKYGVFSSVPPEHKLFMIVFTTAYVARAKNAKKADIEKFLNEPANETIV